MMSRSKRKAVIKDSSKAKKQQSHRRFRREVKQMIQEDKLDKLPEKETEVTNQYDVCDYRWLYNEDNENYDKAKRK